MVMASMVNLFVARVERSETRGVSPGFASAQSGLHLSLQNQIPISIYAPAPALRDHRRGVELLDDRGPRDRRADIKRVALIERRLDRLGRAEMNAPLAFGHGSSRLCPCRLRARLVFRHRDSHAYAIAHHLDRTLLGG